MTLVHHILPRTPVRSLDEYRAQGGGRGLETARGVEREAIVREVEASGLRGRGGAGFPTGRKWRAVRDYRSARWPASVVVNAAEGEPGSFKDRTILRSNPYQVLEGALIAAQAVEADKVIVGLKRSFRAEVRRVGEAVEEVRRAGWSEGVELVVFEGPEAYLFGEETALLEAIDGRDPFPRLAPPYRRGVDELVETQADVGSSLPAHVLMAGDDALAPPTLVDNVETVANVPRIVADGASWFRMSGTAESPGTVVCTITGHTQRHGVGEVMMGTPLHEVIEATGGAPQPGDNIAAVLPGASNPPIPGDQLDVPVSYEGLAAIGSGLGSAAFMVLDDTADLVAAVAGVSRFLAVESCGQCTACKRDGLSLSSLLAKLCRSQADESDLADLHQLVGTVTDGARCSLAAEHQAVVAGLLERFPAAVRAHVDHEASRVEPDDIAALVGIEGDVAVLDERRRSKQPDWTFDQAWSGATPANRLADHRTHIERD
ncbi:MAG TPA: NADH-ubiquinone oxidoreductase-F iron-sulfur binding region domain-containing protein [Acidimicrobiales bacterium]|nr:NADH-ubiquinone oxidoreductase-F iron-sulfur binding region domain-containing protein [Acidimicrobiales bacterium]